MSSDGRGDYGLTLFSPKVSPKDRKKGLFFTAFFILLIILQCCYWLFGNAALPIVMGMPFSMFVIVALIAVEFVALLILYFMDTNDQEVQ